MNQKDEGTLDKLENEYRLLSLEKARNKEPWKLITKPTLLPYPITHREKNSILGLISGIIIGSGFSFGLKEKKA